MRELRHIFRNGFVCIRRFRASDCRLLPLVLDPPLLLKNHAAPSQLALQVRAAHLPWPPTDLRWAPHCVASVLCSAPPQAGIQPRAPAAGSGSAAAASGATGGAAAPAQGVPTEAAAEAAAAEAREREARGAAEEEAARRAMARGLRLFALYVAAGGGLCMRQTVWRRLMPVLHPDKGGDVAVFQHVSALKRQLDAGEAATLSYP